MPYPALFLDRDGVIIENRANYVRKWSDVEIFPQALHGLARLRRTNFKIILITNQSAVGRGIITLKQAEMINKQLVDAIEQAEGRVDGVYMCPHAPDEGCQCRKPLPGMLVQAAREMDIDLSQSILIGDALTDLAAGQAAGVSKVILLRTGRGKDQEQLGEVTRLRPYSVYDDLSVAVEQILEQGLVGF